MIFKENNFDILRITLAMIVVFYHMGNLNDVSWLYAFPGHLAVECFFVISGFLITQSYLRNNDLRTYFKARFLRVYPLYFIVITTSFLVGALITSFSFKEYFINGGGVYLLSNLTFLNFIDPALPGVFESSNHIRPAVNGALWTLKLEVMFYCAVPIIYGYLTQYFSIKKLTVFFGGASVFFYYIMAFLIEKYGLMYALNRQLPSLLCFFMLGAWMSFSIKKNYKIIYLFPLAIIYLFFIDQKVFWLQPIAVGVFTYTLLFLLPSIRVPKSIGDISYGIYIWHYPIIQFYISKGFFENIIFGVVLTLCSVLPLAYISWHLIEKNLVKRRSKLQ